MILRCHSGLDPESRIITYRFPLEFIPAKAGTGMTEFRCLFAGAIEKIFSASYHYFLLEDAAQAPSQNHSLLFRYEFTPIHVKVNTITLSVSSGVFLCLQHLIFT